MFELIIHFTIIIIIGYLVETPNNGHSEKIVYVSPPGSVGDHPPVHSFSQPSPVYGKSHLDGGTYSDSFPSGFSIDQPPLGAQISDSGGHFNGPPEYNLGAEGNYIYGPSHRYGRSNPVENNTIHGYFKLFQHMIRR